MSSPKSSAPAPKDIFTNGRFIGYRSLKEETDVEAVPGDLIAQAQRKVRIGIADDAVIGGGGVATDRRPSVHAPRRGRGAEKYLLPRRRVDVEEHGAVERPQGIPRAIAWPAWVADHDALGPYTALTLSADVSGLVERPRL